MVTCAGEHEKLNAAGSANFNHIQGYLVKYKPLPNSSFLLLHRFNLRNETVIRRATPNALAQTYRAVCDK